MGRQNSLKKTQSAVSLGTLRLANVLWLAVVLIGVPAITSVDLGALRLGSDHWSDQLLFAGLGLGVAANGLLDLFVLRSRPERRCCRGWLVVFGILLAVALLEAFGVIDFQWLKEGLNRGRDAVR